MITKDELAERLKHACAEVIASEAELTEIDSHFGDADHGITMHKIASAIAGAVDDADGSIQEMLDDVAMAVMVLNGGSAVPLWNTWLDGLQEAAPDADAVGTSQLKAMFANALEELDDMSGAKVGVGQLELVDLAIIEDRIPELLEELGRMKAEGRHTAMLLLTDIMKEGSRLLMASDDPEKIAAAFGVALGDNMWLPGVMSRKKQVVPALEAAFKA